jgi:hypothetical protein
MYTLPHLVTFLFTPLLHYLPRFTPNPRRIAHTLTLLLSLNTILFRVSLLVRSANCEQ